MDAFIGFAVVAGFLLFLVLIFRLARRQKEAMAKALRQSGFHAVPDFDAGVSPQVQELISQGRTKARAREIYKYDGMDYDLYRFEHGSGNDRQARFAMVFRQPRFPAFALAPNLNLPGFLDTLAAKVMAHAVGRVGYSEVEVYGRPQFKERFRLYGEDSHLLLKAMPTSIWDRLTALPHPVMLQAQGAVILIQDWAHAKGRQRGGLATDLRRKIEIAESLYAAFRDVEPLTTRVKA